MSWTNPRTLEERAPQRFAAIDLEDAAARLAGVVRRTALRPIPVGDPRIELRGKMENEQVTGAFKARGAWNQVSRLDPEQRRAGVVCPSSGNHGKALAWAAREAGVHAVIVMPDDAYPNKVEACRELGAEVILVAGRDAAEEICRERVRQGAVLVHPYEAERTLQGAGTVGLEIAHDWPEVEVVAIPVGGGGLLAGSSLALRRELGAAVRILGVEPEGAPSMSLGLAAGRPVPLKRIDTQVQGLCPPYSGEINIAIGLETVDAVALLSDEAIFAAQARLVRAGHRVEPAGAASAAGVLSGGIPAPWLEGRGARHPLRVVAVISGGNADPRQLEGLRAGDA
ncbi:MAG: pyridoxal-phosphate dependent enzyme [Acidobacteriota bacterium]